MDTLNDLYKRSALIFLVEHGGVLKTDRTYCQRWEEPHANYYGSGWDYSAEDSMEAFEAISRNGIDFDASSEPSNETSNHFNGTFTDSQLRVDHLRANIVAGGKTFPFAVDFREDEAGFADVLKRLLSYKADLDTALKALENRLTNKYFEYSCTA